MVSELFADFEKIGNGCLSDNLKLNDIYNLYVEINLSGCKYLCKYLHNDTCTLIMFLPNSRSCMLTPLQLIPIVDEHPDCKKVEIHRKHRITGKDLRFTKAPFVNCSAKDISDSANVPVRSIESRSYLTNGIADKLQWHRWHDDVIKWKHFPRYWPFVRGIHRSSVNSAHKGQWRGDLMFSLIGAWTNRWVNNREAGDLRHHRADYDVIVMILNTGDKCFDNSGENGKMMERR